MHRTVMRSVAILCALAVLSTMGGVYAVWRYSEGAHEAYQELNNSIGGFNYLVEDMPDGEVTMIERLDDILNKRYSTDIVIDSLDYLLNETILVRWEPNAPPYVGSMDKNFEAQIAALFGDVLIDTTVSFILKNQDLNWDGYNEIAMYSTSDVLDSDSEWPTNAVCVYLTVFTPVIDASRNVVGYTLVCESMHGYAPEVRYDDDNLTPSFSTDHWRDDIGYMVWNDQTNASDTYRVPEDAMSNDGSMPFRNDYNSYNQYYRYWWQATTPYGQSASQRLAGRIPWLGE